MAEDDGSYLSDLRGLSRLVIDATKGVTDIVESMHHTIEQASMPVGEAPEGRTRGITGFVYETVRTVTVAVGSSLDLLLAQLAPLMDQQPDAPERVYAQGVLNAVIGDYLESTGNPLAIKMRICADGQGLTLEPEALAQALPDATAKPVVFIHGLGVNDIWWQSLEPDYGADLKRDLGYTPLYLRFNTGRHVSHNGKQLADMLDALVQAWPVPVEQLAIVGYSMGGLLARSAVHYASAEPGGFRDKLSHLVTLGTPHHGAPLERGGNWVDFLGGVSPYSAPIFRVGKVRSAGITDLRYGNVLDEDWEGRDRFELQGDPRTPVPLPEGVRVGAVAGRIAHKGGALKAPAQVGDGLVDVASALGRHTDPTRDLGIPPERTRVLVGVDHMRLLNHPAVYAALRQWLADSD